MNSFFNKFKAKLNATRFEFTVSVHMLQPWPAGSKAIAIGWQRGKKRRGATSAIYPHANPGKLDCSLKFSEKFTVPVTLYKASCACRARGRRCARSAGGSTRSLAAGTPRCRVACCAARRSWQLGAGATGRGDGQSTSTPAAGPMARCPGAQPAGMAPRIWAPRGPSPP